MTGGAPRAGEPLAALAARLADGTGDGDEAGEGAAGLVRALVDRARRLEALGAVLHLDADGAGTAAAAADAAAARGERLGPLHGVPFACKDNVDVAGLPTTAGTPALAGDVASRDAPVVAALRAAGAVPLAKTALHELAFGITSDNGWTGPVRNPHDPSRLAGGSSGGTAAAVAAGIAPFGLATDTGGSARIPAALCGVVGFRPTLGRYSGDGVVPLSATRDTVGVTAHTVADVALVDRVLAGTGPGTDIGAGAGTHGAPGADAVASRPELPRPDGLRLGVPRPLWDDLDDGVAAVCTAALDRLQRAGVTLVDCDLAPVVRLDAVAGFPIALYEAARDLATYLTARGTTLADLADRVASPDVAAIVRGLVDDPVPEAAYRAAVDRDVPALRAAWAATLADDRLDAVVYPTTPLPAPPVGVGDTVVLRGRPVPTFPTYARGTNPSSLAAVPALSLPAGQVADGDAAGLPVGLEVDGVGGADARLLAVAAAVEALLPGVPPPDDARLAQAVRDLAGGTTAGGATTGAAGVDAPTATRTGPGDRRDRSVG